MADDLTAKLERLEAFEDRFDLRLSALFAHIDESIKVVIVNGELHPKDGLQLKNHVSIFVDAYDAEGRLVGGTARHVKADSFYGYYSFTIRFETPTTKIARIRIFPQPYKPKPWE